MKISDQCVVSIHYTLTNSAGDTLDSSSGSDPLTYLHGANGLIPGMENNLTGREAGEQFSITVEPDQGYGEVNPGLIEEIPLDALANIENLAVGMQLQSQMPNGGVQTITVDAIGEETATLNANHALAGQVLHFDVSVEAVRAATEEELAHGHAH